MKPYILPPHSFKISAPWFAIVVTGIFWSLLSPLSHAVTPVDVLVVPYRQVSVSFPVGGIVEELSVREGARVEQGDFLGALEHEEERLDARRFEKVLEKRASDHEATASLFLERMTSAEEALDKRIEMEIAEIQYRRALATVERRKLYSPLRGLVVAREREPGEWVDPGTVVLEVVDIDQVYAQLMLSAEESSSVRMGQEIPLVFAAINGDPRFQGTVDFIDPRIDAASGLLKVRVLVDNADHRLPPGLSGFAWLSAGEHEGGSDD
ncbi:MAG: efflux RND transporter periplasmic adaptor subunit [Opitutales bacterium]